jgi:hypothetical protein
LGVGFGYRMHARLDTGRVKIITRRGNDWTRKYPSIAKALAELPAKSAYLDRELCGVLPDGRTALNLIQNTLERGDASLVYFVFDLLYLDGEGLRDLTLSRMMSPRLCAASISTRNPPQSRGNAGASWGMSVIGLLFPICRR